MVVNFLAEDLLLEILARLPVKSLLRFQSVAKSWKNIMKEPTFITKHHLTQVASNRGNCVLTMFHNYYRRSGPGLITEDEQGVKCTDLESPFFNKLDDFYLVSGPCNGLVVISNSRYGNNGDLFIWNPATRECKALPTMTLASTLLSEKIPPWSRFGFGIDPITKDYKVVRIWNLDRSRDEVGDIAEVLSLSSDSRRPNSESWKKIDSVPPLSIFYLTDHVYLDGKYYWCTKPPRYFDEEPCSIVWFDMGTEVFGFIEFPHPRSCWLRFEVLKEMLAIVRYAYTVENKDTYEIWIMDQRSAWTKYATVGPFNQNEVPLGFGKKEELVVVIACDFEFMHESFSYDIKTHVTKKIIGGLLARDMPLAIYNESLISVGGED